MADTIYALGNPLAATILSEELLEQAIYASPASKFIGEDDDSAIRLHDDLTRRAGDTIQYVLEKKLFGAGVLGFDRLKGKEERIQSLPDQFSINAIANAVNEVGEMTQQRVPWSLRKRCRAKLGSWIKERIDVWVCNQLGGNVNGGVGAQDADGNLIGISAGDLRYCGMNAPVAPNTFVYPNSAIVAESGLTGPGQNGSNLFNLQMINRMVTKAKTLKFPIKPIMVGDEPYYILILHPYQLNDLKSQTGEGTWESIQLAAMQGGKINDNPLFTGAIGMYNRVIIHEDFHVPYGDSNQNGLGTCLGLGNTGTNPAPVNGDTSVARALFFGAQAAVMGFGRKTGWPDQVKWVEESDDYMRELGVACELVAGVKKSVFTDTTGTAFDFGCMVGSTWAQTP
jgi:N4-gp56 family major capsid protein